jgi:hypothetical protein
MSLVSYTDIDTKVKQVTALTSVSASNDECVVPPSRTSGLDPMASKTNRIPSSLSEALSEEPFITVFMMYLSGR